MNRIKQENIVEVAIAHEHLNPPHSSFCATCGEPITKKQIETRYICPNCRHIIPETADYCNFCGIPIQKTDVIEHYFSGKLTDADFDKIKPTE